MFWKISSCCIPRSRRNAITKLLLNLPENDFSKILNENGFFEIMSPKYLGGNETIDESGVLTSNIAQIEVRDGKINLGIATYI